LVKLEPPGLDPLPVAARKKAVPIELHSTLETLKANLQLAADQLVQTANDYGGRDNISVVLIHVNDQFAVETGWVSRFMSWLK